MRGLFIVISGPAGSGKGTVVKKLRESLPTIGFSVSATTRAPRPGEEDGVHYHFISKEDFLRKISCGEVLEYTSYCDNYYGTLKSEAERVVEAGRDLILEIEVDGASQIKKICPDAVSIMLIPPDARVLESRLRGRGTESEEVIRRRIKRAAEEISRLPDYDYVVVNETGRDGECADRIASIIMAEHSKTDRMKEITDRFFDI